MSMDYNVFLEQIQRRIYNLQKNYVSLQEKLKTMQNNYERSLNDSALRAIDILDMINTMRSNLVSNDSESLNVQLVIKKVEKRILALLEDWDVQEIMLEDGKIEPGQIRVLDTQKASAELPVGSIVEVCRRGYQRGGRTIRPADVITVSEGKTIPDLET